MILPRLSEVSWRKAYRVVPSRYPPIDLFERLTSDPGEWEALAEVESLTNPRIRDEIGEIHLVPPEERISGTGASWVMAAFTHLNPRGSRFSDGSYGVYYTAREFETAVAETVYHLGKFYAATQDPPLSQDMRSLVGTVDHRFHDIRGEQKNWPQVYDRDDYTASQALARQLRQAESDGIVYDSLRADGGECLGAFRPKAVGVPRQERHLRYHWDGKRISRYFDFRTEEWTWL